MVTAVPMKGRLVGVGPRLSVVATVSPRGPTPRPFPSSHHLLGTRTARVGALRSSEIIIMVAVASAFVLVQWWVAPPPPQTHATLPANVKKPLDKHHHLLDPARLALMDSSEKWCAQSSCCTAYIKRAFSAAEAATALPGNWGKVLIVRALLRQRMMPVMLLDADAFIQVPGWCPRWASDEHALMLAPDPQPWRNPANSGFFLVRPTQAGFDLLDAWVKWHAPFRTLLVCPKLRIPLLCLEMVDRPTPRRDPRDPSPVLPPNISLASGASSRAKTSPNVGPPTASAMAAGATARRAASRAPTAGAARTRAHSTAWSFPLTAVSYRCSRAAFRMRA